MTAISTSRFNLFVLLLAFLSPLSCYAGGQLLAVRVGSHASFDRIVCELSGPVEHQLIEPENSNIELLFRSVETKPNFTMPTLPKGISLISGLGIRHEQPGNLRLVIGTRVEADVTTSILSGNTWRIVLDIQKAKDIVPGNDASHPAKQSKPDYIPGDRPIETRYAELDTGKTQIPADSVLYTKTTITDTSRLWATLAYYYFSLGDTHSASLFKDCYEAETGSTLDLAIPDEEIAAAVQTTSNKLSWRLILSAFVAGLAAGIGFSRFWLRSFFARMKALIKRKKFSAEPAAEILEQDIKTLEKTAVREKVATVNNSVTVDLPAAKAMHEKSKVEAADAQEEDIIKESLMDRRVRRVLELHQSGSDIPSIAKELEMGQDEVKLILDLNQ